MSLDDLYEEENEMEESRLGSGKRGMRFLPLAASVKEDLQEIYELQKEIGSASFKIHTILSSFKESMDSAGSTMESIKEGQDELQQEVDKLAHAGARIKEKLEEMITERLDQLIDYAESSAEFHNKVADSWKAITIAVNATLEANGYDPQTLARRDLEVVRAFKEQEKRRERWSHAVISSFVGVLSTIMLWAYGRAMATNQAETNQAVIEALKVLKKDAPDNIAHSHRKDEIK